MKIFLALFVIGAIIDIEIQWMEMNRDQEAMEM